MISKDRNVSRTFGHAYANRLVKKSYVALCFGQPPAWKEHSLVTGHGRSRHGLWRVYSHEDVGRSLPGGSSVKDMMTRLVILAHVKGPIALDSGNSHTAGGEEEGGVRGERGGKEEREERGRENGVFTTDASSQQVLSERDPVLSIPPLKPSPPQEARPETKTETEIEVSPAVHSEVQNESNFFLVRAFPLTGRTHQIRMHCQLMGMPIAGDVRYGGPEAWSWGDMVWHAHALHAESVSFVHPVNVTEVNISAPLPEWASRAFHSKG